MLAQLTQSPTLHFLCCDPKDSQYLHHYLNNHVRHSRSRSDASVNLETQKEISDAVEQISEDFSAGADILGRLASLDVRMGAQWCLKRPDQEENADSRKDHFCWRECLPEKCLSKHSTRGHRDIHQPNTLTKSG
jgi:hypothetical protein